MKTSLIFISLLLASSLFAQKSLRDSLFGGKMRVPDSVLKAANLPDSAKSSNNNLVKTESKNLGSNEIKTAADPGKVGEVKPDEMLPDSLNRSFVSKQKVFKRFIDANTPIIVGAANDSKKVRKGEYSIEVDYEIALNGKVTTTSIASYPANEFLVQQVAELMQRTPVLAAPVYGDGKPRKYIGKQQFVILKK